MCSENKAGGKDLVEKDFILEKNDDVAETFNDFFISVVLKLNIPRYQDPLIDSDETENQIWHPILIIIEQYNNHPSLIAINNQNMDRQSSCQEISKSKINREI